MPKKQSTAARRARAAARQGVKYTSALRSEETPAEPARTFPGGGRPWVSSWTGDPYGDVNPACGHHMQALCGGCGVVRVRAPSVRETGLPSGTRRESESVQPFRVRFYSGELA
ncbi:hypothetical protein [Streptomyces werraensis]|uniref:hypothetical protein n=1 Tax=Streptomyces werraensis TaxID=68284 RepID=UPI0033B9DE90